MDDTMSLAPLLTIPRLLTALLVLSVFSLNPVAAQNPSDSLEVTSDTPEYCLHLLDRVSEMVREAHAPVPREVTDLSTEGHRMCAHGQTRGGIMRLRSALMMMENGNKTTYR